MRKFGLAAMAMAMAVGVGVLLSASSGAAEPVTLRLATATQGGGFELYGSNLADIVNRTSSDLRIEAKNTKGSLENIDLLAQGSFDIAMVQGVAAHEAFEGIGRQAVDLKIIAAAYSSPGLFVVGPKSDARRVDDLIGKPIAWGTRTSGLTLMAGYAMDGLGLDRDRDFEARYLDRAGNGPPLVLNGAVAAFWGAGVGWPGFQKVTSAGGRFVDFSPEQVAKITGKHAFLKSMTLPAGSYPGQTEDKSAVGVWSFVLARPDLPDEVAYVLTKAMHDGRSALSARLPQAAETTIANTRKAAPPERLHPGTARFLREQGL